MSSLIGDYPPLPDGGDIGPPEPDRAEPWPHPDEVDPGWRDRHPVVAADPDARRRDGGYDGRSVADFEAREAWLLGALTTITVDREIADTWAAGGPPMERRLLEDEIAAELWDLSTQFAHVDARTDAFRAIHARAERGTPR